MSASPSVQIYVHRFSNKNFPTTIEAAQKGGRRKARGYTPRGLCGGTPIEDVRPPIVSPRVGHQNS
eukprot:7330916-Pyramimonas_sp.AAC.1